MDFELPANIQVTKQKKPKNWSYPVQTSEIVLGLGEITKPLHIFYMNTLPGFHYPRSQKKLKFDSFQILGISWHGHLVTEEPYLHMGVHMCKPAQKVKINPIIVNEVFPLMKTWIDGIYRTPTHNALSLYYRMLNATHAYEMGLELIENGERVLFNKVLDLKEKQDEGDNVEGS